MVGVWGDRKLEVEIRRVMMKVMVVKKLKVFWRWMREEYIVMWWVCFCVVGWEGN